MYKYGRSIHMPVVFTMKTFLLVLAFAAVALAEDAIDWDNIDWSTVKRRDIRLPLPFDMDRMIFPDRIVGGLEATPNSIPYQVGLLIATSAGTFFCGGSLISVNFVLTAAHCVEGATQAEVRLGAHQINANEPQQERVFATRFIIHPGWDSSLLRNDIALIQLPRSIELNANIQLISLPTYSQAGNNFVDRQARISGWGLDSDTATAISPVLRFVWSNIISQLACNIRFLGVIQATHVCTSGEGGLGACSGDSGGPLVIDGVVQGGIVSFGLGLGCEIGWPSVFTRVTSFLDWIQANSDVTIRP